MREEVRRLAVPVWKSSSIAAGLESSWLILVAGSKMRAGKGSHRFWMETLVSQPRYSWYYQQSLTFLS